MNDRTKRIPVAVNSDDLIRIKLDAKEAGQSLSTYVRERLKLPKVRRGPKVKREGL